MVREPSAEYERWKTIETLALSLGSNKTNLNTYVICSGVLYGEGEVGLNIHFRSAWLQDPYALPYIDDGDNWIPMIHVKDLASVTKYVY
mmetsp:Transcript_24988/g.4139  ORF Transcript_24988/g.4139 Transcript_24988/m.4139 type:complete len:89 (-) Transcript_24988:1518-1784(-)